MKKFTAKLKRRNLICGIFCLAAVVALLVFRWIPEEEKSENFSLLQGFCVGFILVLEVRIFRNIRCIKDENKLRQLYIAYTDERMLAISREVSTTTCRVLLLLLSFGTIVASFLSETVSGVLGVVMGVMVLLQLGLYVYYQKKM